MFTDLPQSHEAVRNWQWSQFTPYYADLNARPLTAENVAEWLTDWSQLASLLADLNTWFTIATTTNTADEAAEQAYKTYLDTIVPPMQNAEQALKQKLLDSGLEPVGFELPLRKMRTEAALFRESNIPLLAEMRKLSLDYDKIMGSLTVMWDGEEVPRARLVTFLQEVDRDRREKAYRAMFGSVLKEREAFAAIWRKLVEVRQKIAENAGFSSFREYRWQQLFRFDYTPADNLRFLDAIEEVVVPAAKRLAEKRRAKLGVPALRYWDLFVDPANRAPLHPYTTIADLETGISHIFHRVDPQFGAYFDTMRAEKLLDLNLRKHKASGGYMLGFATSRRPFIFTNAVGTHDDITTLLHEGGHSFHWFETAVLPYIQQRREEMIPIEFLEVASTAMELLATPYLVNNKGGFYSEADAARARIEHLETLIDFWPYMALVDAFQHWIYDNSDQSADMDRCDEKWSELAGRYWAAVDWDGLKAEQRGQWYRQSHIFQDPFYYVEYGLAALGAVQIWGNALKDQAGAVAAYRKALALGGTVSLPDLYATAGAKFAFDADTLREAVTLIEAQIAQLEPIANPPA